MAQGPALAVHIDIDIPSQRMLVKTASGEIMTWPISTGRKGFVTPPGSYAPYSLQKMHYSRKYQMAPMPHSIFFHEGYAIHGASSVAQLGRPASHGCIRLAPAHAAKLFNMVKLEGALISIHDAASRAKANEAFAQSLAATPLRGDAATEAALDDWSLRSQKPLD
jgi:lipoprotein-anchoring transpeptidase ErfK/SrfK